MLHYFSACVLAEVSSRFALCVILKKLLSPERRFVGAKTQLSYLGPLEPNQALGGRSSRLFCGHRGACHHVQPRIGHSINLQPERGQQVRLYRERAPTSAEAVEVAWRYVQSLRGTGGNPSWVSDVQDRCRFPTPRPIDGLHRVQGRRNVG